MAIEVKRRQSGSRDVIHVLKLLFRDVMLEGLSVLKEEYPCDVNLRHLDFPILNFDDHDFLLCLLIPWAIESIVQVNQ